MDNVNRDSLAQDKVLILYVLNNINRDITESDLFKFIAPINNMNYFYFKQILADLVDSKLVETYTNDNEDDANFVIYKLTSSGKESLDLTIDILPGLKKLKTDTIIKNQTATIANESSIITEYIPENEHSYTVKCKIIENNSTIFEIRTYVGSIDQAKHISDNWKKNAYEIYPKVLKLLSNEN